MAIKKSLINPYLYRQFSNNPMEMFNYTMTNLMDNYYDSALDQSTDGSFKAVCLSGMRTEDNSGGGVDATDGTLEGNYLRVVVKPLTPFGNILPDPTLAKTPEEASQLISLHQSVFSARSDFELKDTDAPQFGQVLNCYFEGGSMKNSDFSGLRFSKPTGVEFDERYGKVAMLVGVSNMQDLFKNTTSSLMGSLFPTTKYSGNIYTKAQEVRDSKCCKIRGRATPPSRSDDVELAKKVGIPANVLRAIRLIESGGRSPKALRFEAHQWTRKKGSKPPKGYTPGNGHPWSDTASESGRSAFLAAYKLDKNMAVRVSSFGSYQVLGGHGIKYYGSAQKFWTAFNKDPNNVSDILVVAWFNGTPKAVQAAKNLDFTALAVLFNGKSQALHYYDALIAEAYLEAVKAYGEE